VFLRIGLSDALRATVAADLPEDRLAVLGDEQCPVDGNIVLRAVAAARARYGHGLPSLDLRLDKAIPMAAGLGGGSSDAAAALAVAAELWGIEAARGGEDPLAAGLGADVPFFAAGHAAALVTGVGEQVRALPPLRGDPAVLLVTPRMRLSTAEVFAAFDRLPARARSAGAAQVVDELAAALESGMDGRSLAGWADRLREANDLWPAAVSLAPALDDLREHLEGLVNRPVLLSGSGSSLFALYASRDEAQGAGESLAAAGSQNLHGARLAAAGIHIDQRPWRFP
jgi:4-diphosphocytidyl-2-C-methyl-D-erythritol kinase